MNSNKSIIKLSIFHSIVRMLAVSISFFMAIHLSSISISGSQIGILLAIKTVTSILTILPSGLSNDRFKSKNLITVSLILLSVFYFGIFRINQFSLLIPIFFIGGLGTTIYLSSIDSLFYKSTEKKQISKKIGIFQGMNYLAIGTGLIFSGFLLQETFSFENLSLIVATLFIAMAVISHIVLPKSETTKLELLSYKKDIFRPKVLIFLLILFLFAIHYGAESTAYGLFLKKTLNLSMSETGMYMGFAIISMAIMLILIVKNIHKIKVKYLLLSGLLINGIGHILMTIKIPLISFVFRTIHEIGDTAFLFFLYFGIAKLFDLKRIGGNAGIFTFVSTIGATVGALIFGPLGELKGYDIPLIASGIISLVAFGIAIQFLHHFDHENS